MKTLFIAALMIVGLQACGPAPDGDGIRDRSHIYRIVCLNGVQYYTRSDRLAPRFNQDSTVATCENLE